MSHKRTASFYVELQIMHFGYYQRFNEKFLI